MLFVDVETDVAVGFIINSKSTSKQTKTMSLLSILSIELVFCHIAIVAHSETFDALMDATAANYDISGCMSFHLILTRLSAFAPYISSVFRSSLATTTALLPLGRLTL